MIGFHACSEYFSAIAISIDFPGLELSSLDINNPHAITRTSLDVSVILPALKSNNDFLRCFYSIRAALTGQVGYEIIVVVPSCDEFPELAGTDVRFVSQEGSGIYAAMNTGINSANGNYLYFIGQDDILLGAAAKAIKQGIDEESDLVLSDVYWGKSGVFKNCSSRSWLVWRNWCHQGIFYKRERFVNEIGSFPVKFAAQGDHYVNIVFSGLPGLKTSKYKGCIAWYSADGFSSKSPDMVFREAFPDIIRQHFGAFSYLMVVLRRMLLSAIDFMRQQKK